MADKLYLVEIEHITTETYEDNLVEVPELVGFVNEKETHSKTRVVQYSLESATTFFNETVDRMNNKESKISSVALYEIVRRGDIASNGTNVGKTYLHKIQRAYAPLTEEDFEKYAYDIDSIQIGGDFYHVYAIGNSEDLIGDEEGEDYIQYTYNDDEELIIEGDYIKNLCGRNDVRINTVRQVI